MSLLNNIQFDHLTSSFKNIIDLETTAIEYKNAIQAKLVEVKNSYQYLIKHNNKKIFIFCLDALFFQYKCHSNEYENLSRSIMLIVNRMYGDYYKLYNILVMQIKEKNIPLKTVEEPKKFAVYKDLDPFHEYSISEITEVHQACMDIIFELTQHHINMEKSAHNYSMTSNVGMSIMNFMHTLQYEGTLIREQIQLYVNYLNFFHASHENYLKKLVDKIRTFQEEMDNEIKNENGDNIDMSNIDLECIFATTENVEINTILEETEQVLQDNTTLIEEIEETIQNGEQTEENDQQAENECVQENTEIQRIDSNNN